MARRLLPLLLAVTLLGAALGSAASLEVDGGVIQAFSYDVTVTVPTPTQIPPLSGGLDLQPESLQKKSEGNPVTGFITPPSGYDRGDIDVSSLRLCPGTSQCDGGVPASPKPGGGSRLHVQFERAEVITLVKDVLPPTEVTFSVWGLVDGLPFTCSDTMRLVGHEDILTDGVLGSPEGLLGPGVSPTPTATPIEGDALTPPEGEGGATPTATPETIEPVGETTATPAAIPGSGEPGPTGGDEPEETATPTPVLIEEEPPVETATPVPTATPEPSVEATQEPEATPGADPTVEPEAEPSPEPTSVEDVEDDGEPAGETASEDDGETDTEGILGDVAAGLRHHSPRGQGYVAV